MTQTAGAWLSELTSLYTPSLTQFDAARGHRASIEGRLDTHLGVIEFFEIGSLRHGTGVWQYSDADYMAVLKGVMPGSPWTTLQKVKETLQARFPSSTITISRPAVVCKFADGVVEVVPAYPSESGYWIANPAADGWMKSHPKSHNSYVNSVNTKRNGAAKALARQLKIWKYKRVVPISSCYLEMRAAKHMDDETAYVPLLDLRMVLDKLYAANLAAMNDPTGLGSRFGACSSDSSKALALSKLNTAIIRAHKAKDYETDGKHDLAIEQLKLLFNR